MTICNEPCNAPMCMTCVTFTGKIYNLYDNPGSPFGAHDQECNFLQYVLVLFATGILAGYCAP